MNPFKSVLAGIAIFSLAATALAEPSTDATIVRITGSTAFRSAAHSAIVAAFDSLPVAAYNGSSLSGSGQTFFYGMIGGQPVIITTSWAGSVGGIQTVSQGLNINFLPDTLADSTSTPTLVAAGAGATGGTQVSTGTNSKAPDVSMSDSFQSASPFKTPTLNDQKVGVIGFKWITNRGLNPITVNADTTAGSTLVTVASTAGLAVGMTAKSAKLPSPTLKIASIDVGNSQVTLTGTGTGILVGTAIATTFVSPSPITNINPQAAQALYSNGTATLAQFTGNSADASVMVYGSGRDPDSGTRVCTFAESGIGVNSTVTQYKPVVSSGAITSVAPYPAITINGIFFSTGNGGEASGGTLAGYFGNTSAAINGYLIGYVGTGDAPTAINAGGSELTYSGVPYSDAAVKEGLYTFWCYEHVLYPTTWNSAGSGTLLFKKKAIVDAYANLIKTTYAPIKLTEMNCSRQADGAVVYHN